MIEKEENKIIEEQEENLDNNWNEEDYEALLELVVETKLNSKSLDNIFENVGEE